MGLNLHHKTILTILLTVLAALIAAGLFINWQVDHAFESFLTRQDQFFVETPRGNVRVLPDVMMEFRRLRQEQEFTQIERTFHAEVWKGIILAILFSGAAAISIGALYAAHLTQPLRKLRKHVRRLREHHYEEDVQIAGSDEIADLGHAFNDLQGELARVEELRKDAISDMAHEVSSPLQSLIGYTEGIETGIYQTEDKIEEMKISIGRIEKLVEDMRVFSHARAKARAVKWEELALADLVKTLTPPLSKLAENKQLSFAVDIEKDFVLNADQQMLSQILVNLIKNAIEYTEAGAVTVKAEATAGKQTIIVSDTGQGIAAEDLPYIFERFYRADKSRDRSTGGTGLGLAIVKEYVDRLGWAINVESEVGVGTVVHICFSSLS